MLTIGTTAPSIEAVDQDNAPHSLSDVAGQWLVLYFYPKDDTPGCTKEACAFRDSIDDLRKLGAVVWGVSKDDVASHGRFAKKYALNFPLLADPTKEMYAAYDVEKRSTYIIDPQGKIANAYLVQDAEEHPAEVLEDVRELAGMR